MISYILAGMVGWILGWVVLGIIIYFGGGHDEPVDHDPGGI